MNEENFVVQEIKNHICTITLNNPSIHNAFDENLIIRLTNILETVNQDNQVRVVILKANGKHFSAGANLNWMKEMIHFSKEENTKDALRLTKLLETLNHLKKPSIALSHGYCMGGGLGLLACCDIVIAENHAKFCFSEVKLGLIPATIAPYILRSIGYSAARHYFLTAEFFTAKTAKKIGLVHYLCDHEMLMEKGLEVANTLLKNSPQALVEVKKLLNLISPVSNDLMQETANLLAKIRVSDEGQEGIRAFLEKRTPNWINKKEDV